MRSTKSEGSFDLAEQSEQEKSDNWWYRIYIAAIINTIFVITALWAFSKAFE